ncbi:MAG: helix-turn-helix transcriptional regulator [Actinomycetes bacterium]
MGACELRHFVRPCLLLLLRLQSDHGYDLAQRLRDLGVDTPDAGSVYRALRGLESENLVTSQWVPPESGPARRIYQLTAAGEAALAAEVRELASTRATVDRFLRAYAQTRVPVPAGTAGSLNGNGRVDPLLGPHATPPAGRAPRTSAPRTSAPGTEPGPKETR